MKEYPSIPKQRKDGVVYLFDKIDGSNIRVEWNRKWKCFTKFGSRTQLIDSSHPTLGSAVQIVKTKYEKELNKRLTDYRAQKAILFLEFHGSNSFAGNHEPSDVKDVTLIDISVHPKGILIPKDYLELTEGLDRAALLYHGRLDEGIVQQIQEGTFPGMTFEGVVAKANSGSPGLPDMFKIKNKNWLLKLKTFCKDDEQMYERLQ